MEHLLKYAVTQRRPHEPVFPLFFTQKNKISDKFQNYYESSIFGKQYRSRDQKNGNMNNDNNLDKSGRRRGISIEMYDDKEKEKYWSFNSLFQRININNQKQQQKQKSKSKKKEEKEDVNQNRILLFGWGLFYMRENIEFLRMKCRLPAAPHKGMVESLQV
ncbi:MAG: hypothetical protein EZS28_016672 [Streblomastix strix]|uniref:Uncharacterized protein n=1 Tax=Streblomastix strix TaxID=222440 RepID=A0A5J4VZ27_9EUKA|nr:MAG: hypothetical protein EZS28_016672 [Streblomastix strix]